MSPDPLETVDAALDDAAQASLWAFTPAERVSWAAHVATILARVQALLGMAMLAVDQSDLSQVPGRSAATAVADATKRRTSDLARSLGLSRWLLGYPEFEQAALDGRLSEAHLYALKKLENKRTRSHLPESQEYLIEAAVSCNWEEFRQVLGYWAQVFDPDGEEPDQQYNDRALRLHKNSDGTVSGKFFLDPVSGAALTEAIERHVQRLLEEDKASGNERTAAQRKADALVELIMRGAANGSGSVPAPLVHIVLGAVTAADAFSRLDPDPQCDHNDQPCAHRNGGPHGTNLNTEAAAEAGEVEDDSEPGGQDPLPHSDEASDSPTGDETDPVDEAGSAAQDTERPDGAEPGGDADDGAEPSDDAGPEEEMEFPGVDDEDALRDWLWEGNPPPPPEPGPNRWRPPGQPKPLFPLPDRLPVDPYDPDRRCELANGTPLHPKLAIAALATATVRRLVLGSKGEVLDVGRAERFFPGYMRQALMASGRGRCATPACDALSAWLQVDHVWPWNLGGRTAVKNGQLLCGRCNKLKADTPPPSHNTSGNNSADSDRPG